jgi:putative phosphonate metabolism protein
MLYKLENAVFQRYAVYYTPGGALAQTGAAWLGWDVATGLRVAHPPLDGLDIEKLTRTPRRYGLHATIKPPFHLTEGTDEEMLRRDLQSLCARLGPVTLDALEIHALAGFVAMVPAGDAAALADLAAQVVKELDPFRAAPTASELARRRQANLTPRQDANLVTWGYPYVMEDFRFHITLTGRIKGNMAPVVAALRRHFAPHLPQPFVVDSLALVGEDEAGMFHEIHRFSLGG